MAGHRGTWLALAAGFAFIALVAGLAVVAYRRLPDVDVGASWGAIAMTLIGGGLLIALFLWLGRKARRGRDAL
jgi:Na+-transporting NADH:ubiquinone oxidoreductase subunit NqrB